MSIMESASNIVLSNIAQRLQTTSSNEAHEPAIQAGGYKHRNDICMIVAIVYGLWQR